MATIDEKIRVNTHDVLSAASAHNKLPRDAAEDLARARVLEAMSFRRSA